MKQKRKGSIPIDILYLPALVLLTVFVIYPLISGVQISFTNWNGYSSKYKYVGLANYVKMFHDKMVSEVRRSRRSLEWHMRCCFRRDSMDRH